MLSHSCGPNTAITFDNNKMFLMITRVIEPGEQLFSNFQALFFLCDIAARQFKLRTQYFFECKCEACEKKFPLLWTLPMKIKDASFQEKWKNLLTTRETHSPTIADNHTEKLFKTACTLLTKNKGFYPCMELVSLQLYLTDHFGLCVKSKLSSRMVKKL